jgi:hypothetical protein
MDVTELNTIKLYWLHADAKCSTSYLFPETHYCLHSYDRLEAARIFGGVCFMTV